MALKINYSKEVKFLPTENENIVKNLKNSILTETVSIKNCYAQIVKIDGNKNRLNLKVNIYENKEKQNLIDEKIYLFQPNIAENSENFIKQGYLYLKTLEEYQDAEDC